MIELWEELSMYQKAYNALEAIPMSYRSTFHHNYYNELAVRIIELNAALDYINRSKDDNDE